MYDIITLHNFFCGIECIGHSFTNRSFCIFEMPAWIRTQRAALASRRATNLAPISPPNLPKNISSPSTNTYAILYENTALKYMCHLSFITLFVRTCTVTYCVGKSDDSEAPVSLTYMYGGTHCKVSTRTISLC
jgi:hypothetical protein